MSDEISNSKQKTEYKNPQEENKDDLVNTKHKLATNTRKCSIIEHELWEDKDTTS